MQAKRILRFLENIRANNNREWFNAHKEEYQAVRADFEDSVTGFTVTRAFLLTSRLTSRILVHI